MTGGGMGKLLLHGTKRQFLPAVLRDGLKPSLFCEKLVVCLTKNLPQARANTDGDYGCVLVVDVSGLPVRELGFVTCPVTIEARRISLLIHHPLRFRIYQHWGIRD